MATDYGIRPLQYRLPEATHVAGVVLQVADLDRSIAYYEQVIGLRVQQRDRSVARLGPHADETTLLELRERSGARHVPPQGHLGLYHFAILLPNRTDLGRFVAHLSQQDVRVGSADHLVSESIYLWDADGLGIEVYADRPRSEWRVDGDQLRMATIPLDLRGLMRAAERSVWSGAPAGTTIGHVHLNVGELSRAEAFYHAGVGLDKVVWSFPGALFLSAGGYHHHLGTNTWARGASPATAEDARLLEWQLVLPSIHDVQKASESIRKAGHLVTECDDDYVTQDDWGTALRLTARR
jgi:catechol 2,3-dioxygenase